MNVISDGKWIEIEESELKSKLGLFNYKQAKSSKSVKIEDCLVNRIVLQKLAKEPIKVIDAFYKPDYSSEWDTEELQNVKSMLKPGQFGDIVLMANIGNVLNRSAMGSGKTVEAVVLMRILHIKSAIIVAPKSVLYQWKKTIEQWYPDVANIVEVCPENPTKNKILIYNYEKLSRSRTLIEKIQSLGQFEIHICDEAHRLKNRNSKRTLAMKSIPSHRRVALTGTPWTNRPDDLWSLLNWLDPMYSGRSYWNFTYYFCDIKQDFWGQKIEGLTKDEERIKVLTELLNNVSVYNKGRTIGTKKSIKVKLKMEKAQRTLYDKTKKLILDELPETLTIANGAVLAIRLQQISSWPGQFDEPRKKYGPGVKFEWIKDMVEDNPEEKFVVFTRFATSAKALSEYLDGKCVMYIGEMNPFEREGAKRIFKENDEIRVLVGTIGAMGEGVDGLQYASRVAIFFDRDWSPSTMEQCEDRLNRTGQTKEVLCYYLECDKSFDQHVGKVNISKAEDIRRVLTNESISSV